MALSKCALYPDSAGYSVVDAENVISTKLDGGASRYRLDMLDSASKVSVKWVCNSNQYQYIRAFYVSILKNGSLPFLIDLILDSSEPVEHEAYFIPGTLSLSEHSGNYYSVVAQLEVVPKPIDESVNVQMILFGEFGSDYQTEFPAFEDVFDNLMNVQIPADLVL